MLNSPETSSTEDISSSSGYKPIPKSCCRPEVASHLSARNLASGQQLDRTGHISDETILAMPHSCRCASQSRLKSYSEQGRGTHMFDCRVRSAYASSIANTANFSTLHSIERVRPMCLKELRNSLDSTAFVPLWVCILEGGSMSVSKKIEERYHVVVGERVRNSPL
jgi:hypothetical protein